MRYANPVSWHETKEVLMSRKIVVIGGVVLGPKAASRITRMDADAEVTLVYSDRKSVV